MPAFFLAQKWEHLLCHGNALQHGVTCCAFVQNPKYLILDLETVEDDFDYNVDGNVTIDPQIPVALVDFEAADSYSVDRKNTVLNDVRRFFGLNQDGGTVAIANYAPELMFNPEALPLPANPEAAGYGVQPGNVVGY